MSTNHKENMAFEARARRVAEAVWNVPPGHCQPTHYQGDPVVREIDGMVRLRDVTHLIMVTTSTRLDKIKDDCKKLHAAETIERQTAIAVSKWIITEKQLDAEHVGYARKQNVCVLSLTDFQRRFFDSSKYLALRDRVPFGSARNPATGNIEFPVGAYVTLPMKIAFDSKKGTNKTSTKAISLEQLCSRIQNGETVILRAPFGSGKSLTNRELFHLLSAKHGSDPTQPIPIALNLREHWGEDFSDEMLDRHARTIGYTPKEDLVIAWRAGMCCLLLDGFDEVAAQSVVRVNNRNFMREARRRALQGVRDFTQKLPNCTGILICGRDQYFDSDQELANALGIAGRNYLIVDLYEFDEESASSFLLRNGIDKPLPDWLPRKPLILSYLIAENLFEEILAIDGEKGFGHAWDSFIAAICLREASLDKSTMEAETVRLVLERLAFSVRAKASGTGPISGIDLAESYFSETGQTAGEGVLAQLQRLPGLAQRDVDSGSRSFVDHDMLAALQGSAFARHALAAFETISVSPISELSEKAQCMAAHVLLRGSTSADTLISLCTQLLRNSTRRPGASQHAADCLAVAMRLAMSEQHVAVLDLRGTVIEGGCFDRLALDEVSLRGVSFRNCTFREIHLGGETAESGVSISSSNIARVVGASNRGGIPHGLVSDDCEILEFDNVTTNSAVLKLDLPPQLKALLTILRKLYKQAGSGRKVAALSRGITSPDVRNFISPVLDILSKHRFVSVFNAVVHPVRMQSSRVEAILSSPSICNDPVAIEVRNLQ